MSLYEDKAAAELKERAALKEKIMKIIMNRCEVHDDGRVLPGAIQLYVWHELGFRGICERDFGQFVMKTLAENGFIKRAYMGADFVAGIKWKGETLDDWRTPKAADLPHWKGQKLRYRYDNPDGTMTLNKPRGNNESHTE